MKKSDGLLKKKLLIAALALLVLAAAPLPSFAFWNQGRNPKDAPAGADPSPAGRNSAPALDIRGEDGAADNGAAAVMRAGEISSASREAASLRAASGFDAFNSRSGNQWQATFSRQTGTVKKLYGAASQPYNGSPESGAREFLKSAHAMFGLKSDISELRTQEVSTAAQRRHVSFQQTYNGADILGARILVHSDQQGRVTMVQNSCLTGVEPANKDTLTPEAAQDIARDDLRTKLGSGATLSDSKVEKLIAMYQGRHLFVWKVSTPAQNPPGLWVYHVDADNGAVLYSENEIVNLKSGSGRAYLTNDDYWTSRTSPVKLNYLFTPDEGYIQGLLRGLRTTIDDYEGYYAYSPVLKFTYDVATAKPLFDQAHAYYHLTAIWEWWNKNIISKYGPGNIDYFYRYSMPAIVNTTGICNAFYSPDMGNSLPGFVFGDENTCAWPNEDLVIDTDVVRHEYAHAIMDWAGFDEQFGGEVNGYGRAMGEGNSDWYAFLVSTKPMIGTVFYPVYGLRNIDNFRKYPDDVDMPDDIDAEPDMPEEHYTGEIWGGYLYDLSRVLKKSALKYVYTSSFYFSAAGGHRDGYPDFVDAIRAQFDAEMDMTGSNKQSLKAFGTMVSRGFIRPLSPVYSHPTDYFGTGASGTDDQDYLYLTAPLNLNTPSNLLISGDPHEYPFEAQEGMLMVAGVSAKSGGLKAPIIELLAIDGTLLEVVDYSANPSVTKAGMTYTIPASGKYVVRVSGTNSGTARGYYTFKLSVQ